MDNVIEMFGVGPREDSIRLLKEIMPECIRQTASEVGEEGVKAFFDGYKESIDAASLAA